MKAKLLLLTTVFFCLSVGVPAQAQTTRRLTITLLPAKESAGRPAKESAGSKDNLLWIQNNPPKDVYLQFDLSALPQGLSPANFVGCTLRLVARDVTYEPADNPDSGGQLVIVKGQLVNNDFTPLAETQDKDIASLSTLSDTPSKKNSVGLQATDALVKAVADKYAGNKQISFRLHSDSHKASSLFYSTQAFGETPSNKPRLVIEYTLPPPGLLETASWPQHQQNPEHTGRNPWIPFRAPTGFSLVSIPLPKIDGNEGAVADYPLIYQGNLYLISKVLDQNYLRSFDFKGVERWQSPIPIGTGTVQRSPVISRDGILYVVTENQIVGYDLTQSGKKYASFFLSKRKLSSYTGLTLGNDGSLFLAMLENEQNYVYGFTPSLDPFLKAGPFGTGQEKISTITVSPDGRKIFAQIPKGGVVIDIANPSEQRPITLATSTDTDKPLEYYYLPVAGPAGDIMIFSDFTSTANKGNIWGYSEKQRIWSASGTLLPQPVLGSNGRVYYIQGGVLYGHKNEVGMADIFSGAQATAEIANGVVTKINIKDGGQNYQKPPEVTFISGDGSGAQATAETANGVVTKINITNGGQGYQNPPVVRFTGELNTTSNLVMDGADNIYFWDNDYLYGYSPEAKPLFEKVDLTKEKVETQRPADPEAVSDTEKAMRIKESSGPEQFIRLMIGPDGTLWANNKNGNALYAFKPSYALPNLTLQQKDIKTQTAYRATGRLTVGDVTDMQKVGGVTVSGGTQLLLEAQNGISFATGFKVQKGASILARTGF